MKISILGGGRWARTIATVLCSLPSRSDSLVIHSRHSAQAVAALIERLRLGDRLRLSAAWPDLASARGRPDAVIVANRVSDHVPATYAALLAGVPVLVEKPMALPASRIVQLCKLATANRALLAASHVFLFARYFEAFADTVAKSGKPQRISVTWTDGPSETRRGEVKAYDPGVTVFDDILPHIVPMVNCLQSGGLSLNSVAVLRGGAEIAVETQSDGVRASLLLARDGSGRRRMIEVETDGGPCSLDFSTEPGFIQAPGIARNGDPRWDSAPRPLATMLNAFLTAAEGGSLEPRLSPDHALQAANLADAVRASYLAHQVRWLEKRLGNSLDEPLRYALKELTGDDDRGDMDATEALWAAMDDTASLKTLLSKSRLVSDAGYAM